MLRCTGKVKMDLGKIRQLTGATSIALEGTTDALLDDVIKARVMPRDLSTPGDLQEESTYVDKSNSKAGNVSIISSAPYAKRLYFHPEYHFDHDVNPNARGMWYDDWLPGGAKAGFCQDAFRKLYKRCAKL